MSITQFFQCGYLPEPLNQNRYDICKWKKKKAAYKPPQTVDKLGAGIIPAPFFPLKLIVSKNFLEIFAFVHLAIRSYQEILPVFLDSYMQK